MDSNFENNFRNTINILSSNVGSQFSSQWVGSVQDEIDEMTHRMIEEAQSKNLPADQLQGFMMELFHTHTFNANAKINHSSAYATQPDVNTLGSADIIVRDGSKVIQYSSKSYKTGQASAAKQAESLWERYSKLKSNAEKRGEEYMSFEEFLESKGFSPDQTKHQSLYFGQGKLIPADQLEDAKRFLREKIEKESVTRPEIAQKYREVLESLTDVVSDGNGNCSIKLTREQAQALAQAAKEGHIDKELLDKLGLKLSDLITPADIMEEAFRAGLSAAVISLVLSVAPIIVNCISDLISKGEISVDDLKKGGLNAISSSGKAFLTGSIAAAVTVCCKTGRLGEALTGADPSVIGTLVVMTVETLDNSLKFALGKISKQELVQNLARMYFTTAFSTGVGMILQAVFPEAPVVAYLIGSFIGSVVGGFIYNRTESLLLSFCISSGCTFFGIVDQNYELPKEFLDNMGLEQIEEDRINSELFEPELFEEATFSAESFEYEKIDVKILKRGIIGVFNIGYVA